MNRPTFNGWVRKLVFAGCAIALAGMILATQVYPGLGAEGADLLRGVFGDEIVARIETVLFKTEDTVKGLEYRAGLKKPQAPWAVAPSGITPPPPNAAGGTPAAQQALPGLARRSRAAKASSETAQGSTPTAPGISGPGAGEQKTWPPANLSPLGDLAGEGVWSAYIRDSSGNVVAYRTFLQPDPGRPYVIAAVVAFHVRDIRLHFVLGMDEPYELASTPRARGAIPSQDLRPDVLLAAFNGGFRVRHGHFGAMANGLTSVPLRDGLATVAIYQDGSVRIGQWGSDSLPKTGLQAVRQNGVLIVSQGQVTAQVDNPDLWGYTLSGSAVTWRSALGIDARNEVLYYFAGPYTTVSTLTKAIAAAGVFEAMQLDINNYWVHFDAIRAQGSALVPEPLFPEMSASANRFLRPYARDFFYITANP